jgi:surface antigen
MRLAGWICAALLASGLLSSCSPVMVGGGAPTITGAAAGGVIDRELVPVDRESGPPVGPVAGELLDAPIWRSLTERDRALALKTEYEALEYARPRTYSSWRNPESGNRGRISVGLTSQVNKLDCREFIHEIVIGGRTRVDRGTACRRPNAVWRVLD